MTGLDQMCDIGTFMNHWSHIDPPGNSIAFCLSDSRGGALRAFLTGRPCVCVCVRRPVDSCGLVLDLCTFCFSNIGVYYETASKAVHHLTPRCSRYTKQPRCCSLDVWKSWNTWHPPVMVRDLELKGPVLRNWKLLQWGTGSWVLATNHAVA